MSAVRHRGPRPRVATRSATCRDRAPARTRTERARRRPARARRRRRPSGARPAEWVCVEPKRSKTVTSALSPATTSVCGKLAKPSPSDQCNTTIGLSTTTPAGTFTTAPPARKASCRTVNASGDASEHTPSTSATSASSQVASPQTFTPLATSASSSEWCTTRPFRTTMRPDRSPASAATGPPPGAASSPGWPSSSGGTGRNRSRSSSSIRL